MDAHGNPSTPQEALRWLTERSTPERVAALMQKLDTATEGEQNVTVLLALATKLGMHCGDALGRPHPLLTAGIGLAIHTAWSQAALELQEAAGHA